MCDVCKSQESGEVFEFGIFLHTETATRSANVITNTKIDSDFSPLPGKPFHRMIFCDECIRAHRKRDNIRTAIFIAAFLVLTMILLVFAITGNNTGPQWAGVVIFGIFTSICLFGLLTKTPLSDLFKKEVIAYANELGRNHFVEKDKYNDKYNRRYNEVLRQTYSKHNIRLRKKFPTPPAPNGVVGSGTKDVLSSLRVTSGSSAVGASDVQATARSEVLFVSKPHSPPPGALSREQNMFPQLYPINAQTSTTISMAEFNAIQNGMSYDQVVQIVGGPGEKVAEAGSPGSPAYTIVYKWTGEGTIGANAHVVFLKGVVSSKGQAGLQ